MFFQKNHAEERLQQFYLIWVLLIFYLSTMIQDTFLAASEPSKSFDATASAREEMAKIRNIVYNTYRKNYF